MTPRLWNVIKGVVILGVLIVLGRLGPERIASFLRSPLSLIIMLTVFGIGALAFIYYDGQHVWHSWFPDQPFNPTVKRWLRYLLQAFTAALAHVQVRAYINFLTGVDPGNFPTALAALTVLNTLAWWLVVLPIVMLVMAGVYALAAWIAGAWGDTIAGISRRRWEFRAFGAFSVMIMCMVLYLAPAQHPWGHRVVRIITTNTLLATEFSYDRTCAVSSENRPVARLKDLKEMKASKVIIAEFQAWFDAVSFPIGTCEDQLQP